MNHRDQLTTTFRFECKQKVLNMLISTDFTKENVFISLICFTFLTNFDKKIFFTNIMCTGDSFSGWLWNALNLIGNFFDDYSL